MVCILLYLIFMKFFGVISILFSSLVLANASEKVVSDFLSKAEVAGQQVTNGQGITLKYIPSGKFTMGSPKTEKSRGRDEDQAEVIITKPYLIGMTEVTQKQWANVMGVTLAELIETMKGPLNRGANLKNEPSAIGDTEPMCFVNYQDALDFCAKLTTLERASGHITEEEAYTLPTEAQWEYAARAGSKTVFPQGNTLNGNQANFYSPSPYGDTEKLEYRDKTTPVGTFPANAWGLHDMQGNVYEWCIDFYTEALAGGVDPAEMKEGDSRCIRGGAWNRPAKSSRSAYRYSYDPSQRTRSIGFRVVLVEL